MVAEERREVRVGVEQRSVQVRRADEDHPHPDGHRHRPQRRRVQTERPEGILGADALLAEHALHALPDDRIRHEIRRAHHEHAARRAMERARADAHEVGDERPEASAPLEIPEDVRIRGVRVVEDRRRRDRRSAAVLRGAVRDRGRDRGRHRGRHRGRDRVRDQKIHLEASQPRGVLRIVILAAAAVFAAAAAGRVAAGVVADEVFPVLDEGLLHLREVGTDDLAHGAERGLELGEDRLDDLRHRLAEGLVALLLEALALRPHQERHLLDFGREPLLGVG